MSERRWVHVQKDDTWEPTEVECLQERIAMYLWETEPEQSGLARGPGTRSDSEVARQLLIDVNQYLRRLTPHT